MSGWPGGWVLVNGCRCMGVGVWVGCEAGMISSRLDWLWGRLAGWRPGGWVMVSGVLVDGRVGAH